MVCGAALTRPCLGAGVTVHLGSLSTLEVAVHLRFTVHLVGNCPRGVTADLGGDCPPEVAVHLGSLSTLEVTVHLGSLPTWGEEVT